MSQETPNSWTESTFGELNQFSSRTINPADYPNETFELYSVPSFPSATPEKLSGAEIGSSKQAVSPNDVLVCKINPRINRVWHVGEKAELRQIASSEWIGFRAPGMSQRFFQHYFSSHEFRDNICQDVTGVGGSLTRAQPKNVVRFQIPLPPLPEQTRIANKLDTLLARVDSARDRLDRVPGMLKRFRQAVLTAATSGGLTEAWRGDGASNWIETDVQSIAAVGTGSTPLRSNPAFFSSEGTPWVTSAATSQVLIQSAEEFVTSAAINAHRLKVFPIGTLLVAMYGEGKTRGQVSQLGILATINQACAAIAVDQSKALSGFIKLVLQANYFEMRAMAEGGNQPNLNLSKIKEFPIQLPTLPEQTEIVRQVEILLAYADRLEARLKTARKLSESLSPAILAKAFRGELVAQDPNDEPASELLKRIRAGRK
jgi:type I restriction enzyme, S subunit